MALPVKPKVYKVITAEAAAAHINKQKAKPKARPKKRVLKPATPPAIFVAPTAPMAGFSEFKPDDYAVKVPGYRDGEERYLTVSPLRAIQEEQAEASEHVVTKRTRQGVLYGAGLGMEPKVLARIMGVPTDELQALYAPELETATHLMMSDVQTNLYNIARDPRHTSSVKAGVYLLGKLGNRVYQEARIATQTALMVNPTTRTIDPSLLDDDQRDALKDILLAAMRLAQPAVMVEGEYTEIEEDGEDVL